jgi:UDP-2,3-diacylglucosamine pyrophosphatase LpxH/methionine-rich copper-binding protein CopC
MNVQKKLVLVIAGIVLVSILFLWSAQQSKIMTFDSNIALSTEADNPPVNDSIQTINLKFSEKLDPKTVAEAVKLYTINAQGEAIETNSLVALSSNDETTLSINTPDWTSFIGGEEYKIQISSALQSATGVSVGADYEGYFATNYDCNLTGIADLNNERSQIVLISDLHLGIDDDFAETVENRPALVDFLNQIKTSPNVKELVIVGDLFDGWFLPMNYTLPDSQSEFFDAVAANNQMVVDAINAIITMGQVKVTYVPGNHDLLLTQADVARIFPGINQGRDDVQGLGTYITGANSEIVVEHGHRCNFFCAPDFISNRDITQNSTSILPPGYFFTRIATSSMVEGQPKTSNVFPEMTVPAKNDTSQFNAYLYYQGWKGLMTILPVNESLTDKVIKTNIDGYTEDYAINDVVPQQNTDGTIDVNLYKEIQDNWDKRQDINHVTVEIPTAKAITQAATSSFTDEMAKIQYFDVDASKRIVVFGHSHIGMILPETNLEGQKTIYANTGTWIDENPYAPTRTFVVITPAKPDSAIETVNYYQYSNDHTITQWGEGQAIVQ